MSYDQLIGAGSYWNPSVKGVSSAQGAGDDNYNVPGATVLPPSTGQSSGGPSSIAAGDASGFADYSDYTNASLIPTLVQIGASSGVNQVIGMLNRRTKMWNSLYGTSLSPQAYVTVGSNVTAAKFNAICSAITSLLSAEGFAAYSFPGTSFADGNICAGCKIYGYHLATMRRALCLAGSQTLNISFNNTGTNKEYKWAETDGTTWNTPTTGPAVVAWSYSYAGRQSSQRYRHMFYYGIPDYAASGGIATFQSVALGFTAVTDIAHSQTYQLDVFNKIKLTVPPVTGDFNIVNNSSNFIYETGLGYASMSGAAWSASVGSARVANAAYILGTNTGMICYEIVVNAEAKNEPDVGNMDGSSLTPNHNITDHSACNWGASQYLPLVLNWGSYP